MCPHSWCPANLWGSRTILTPTRYVALPHLVTSWLHPGQREDVGSLWGSRQSELSLGVQGRQVCPLCPASFAVLTRPGWSLGNQAPSCSVSSAQGLLATPSPGSCERSGVSLRPQVPVAGGAAREQGGVARAVPQAPGRLPLLPTSAHGRAPALPTAGLHSAPGLCCRVWVPQEASR